MSNEFLSGLDTSGVESGGDVLGGGKFKPFESDIYLATVKAAYLGQSASGAKSVSVILNIQEGDGEPREYSESLYITSREGKTHYVDKNSGVKKFLPGYQNADDLCLLTTGQDLKSQNIEEKVIKLYDFDQRQEVNTAVPMLVDMLGKPVYVALMKSIVDKQKRGDDGQYHNTGEQREKNDISKFFHSDTKGTVFEYQSNKTLGEFHDKWLEQNKGRTPNLFKGIQGSTQGRPGAPGASGNTPPTSGASTPSLFNR